MTMGPLPTGGTDPERQRAFLYFDAQIGKNAKTNAEQTLKQTLAI